VARELKNIRSDIPILLCSGFQEKEDLEKLASLGISQLIIKPTKMSILAKAIRDVLDKKQISTKEGN
jgi:two-component system, cell cycle sensor histidine kinase and response regulator CckA